MHAPFLRRCLTLAEQGRGKTGINPLVGAVLVRGGKIIAEGYHAEFGGVHAERMLLEAYSGEILPTDTLVVNMEPCCHERKKTPPCTDLILTRGIKTVVYGMIDPNPKVNGRGISVLNKNGVQTIGPVLEQECKRQNRGFTSLMKVGRPWITMKSARTSDGNFAHADGSPLKITSPEQDRWSHEFLRARHDAILVGVGTIVTDDPALTVRFRPTTLTPPHADACVTPLPMGEGTGVRVNWRIILDPHLRIPLHAKVISDLFVSRTIVITTPDADERKKRKLKDAGVRIFEVPLSTGAGLRPAVGDHFDWSALWKVLTTPTENFYGITSILVEGGPTTWEVFRIAGMVDEEVTFVGSE